MWIENKFLSWTKWNFRRLHFSEAIIIRLDSSGWVHRSYESSDELEGKEGSHSESKPNRKRNTKNKHKDIVHCQTIFGYRVQYTPHKQEYQVELDTVIIQFCHHQTKTKETKTHTKSKQNKTKVANPSYDAATSARHKSHLPRSPPSQEGA